MEISTENRRKPGKKQNHHSLLRYHQRVVYNTQSPNYLHNQLRQYTLGHNIVCMFMTLLI